jgi:toxin ParE1/3/4
VVRGKRPGLGVGFVEAIERATDRAIERPGSFPTILGQPLVLRVLVQKFPYAVVFSVRENAIHVLAYAHAKRRPLYWAHRMIDEDE